MKIYHRASFIAVALNCCLASALVAQQQVGDFRLNSGAPYNNRSFAFDSSFSFTTRDVTGAPVQVPSTLSGVTQNGVAPAGDVSTDFYVRNFSSSTSFRNHTRFGPDPDGPSGPEGGNTAIGAKQWTFDLSVLETYLTTNSETLTGLDLRMILNPNSSGLTKLFDIYLSYTEPSESITLTDISDDPSVNYTDWWFAARSGAEGDVINGTHKILKLNTSGAQDFMESFLALYQAGVREVNVVVIVGEFFSGRHLTVPAGAGLYITTDVVTVAEQVSDLRLPTGGTFPNSTNVAFDRIEDFDTRTTGSLVLEIPTTFSATSQIQGGNPVSPLQGLAFFDIDGIEGNTGSTASGADATVLGYGAAGIGATAADGFQYTALVGTGDFDYSATLLSMSITPPSARAGLMVRQDDSVDAAHVFLGFQQSGEIVVVVRDAAGNTATQTIGTQFLPPVEFRIQRVGDVFSFFVDGVAAVDPDATVVMSGDVLAGFAVTSGSDVIGESTIAEFTNSSINLPSPDDDISIRTEEFTRIQTLNRFTSTTSAGAAQWAIDLMPLEDYLTVNGLSLTGLELRLLAIASDTVRPVDAYLSYTNPTDNISLASLSADLATTKNLGDLNYDDFIVPALGATVGDIVGGTHKVLRTATAGDFNLTEDILSLYDQGVRELNLILSTDDFYKNKNLDIQDGSGIFIETTGGSSAIEITSCGFSGSSFVVQVDGLTNGQTYHLRSSSDMVTFDPIAGSDVVATGSADTFSNDPDLMTDPRLFYQIFEGSASSL
ncbi:MAG: hypothetical protein AAGC74_00020 [Verrucomicrobiota bacterium]